MATNQIVKRRLTVAGVSASIVLAGSVLVAPWEGLSLTAYPDVIGVWTVCYGETKGVKRGDRYTNEQCADQLALSLPAYHRQMMQAVKVPLKPHEEAAYLSFTYNVGVGNFTKSTLLKKLNNKQYKVACDELKKWVYADGKKFQGLVNRREDEYKMCTGTHPSLERGG